MGSDQHTREDERALLDRLVDCHARMRDMMTLAVRLAAEPRLTDDELVDGAERVRRYFRRALVMHVRDEEESILPRLARSAPEAAAPLEEMRHEHRDHEELVRSLVASCQDVADAPSGWEDFRDALARAANALQATMLEHLEHEETRIFPAIETLDPGAQAQILAEMDARRAEDGGGGRGRGGGGAGARG